MDIRRICQLALVPAAAFAVLSTAGIARADDEDKAACADKGEGDPCTDGDGEPGTCVPDDSDPNVLTCDDDGGNNSGSNTTTVGGTTSNRDDDDGCAIGGRGSLGMLAVLGIVAARRRRR